MSDNGNFEPPRKASSQSTGSPPSSEPVEQGPRLTSVARPSGQILHTLSPGRTLGHGGKDAKLTSSGAFGVRKEWTSELRMPSNWMVKADCLERLPVEFPLERTHREILDADASTVANRISEALRKLSIEAEYDDQKAKAKCRTSDFVSFRIRLYAGGDGGLPVVVELQRRQGSPMSFMNTCKAVLCAAEGRPLPEKKKLPPFMKTPIGGMKCLQGAVLKEQDHDDVHRSMEKAIDLISSKQLDSNVLGLEQLCMLTDTMKSSNKVATQVATSVIAGDEKFPLRDEIEVLLKRCLEQLECQDGSDSLILDHTKKIRHLMLRVYSNSLSVTSQFGFLAMELKRQKWFAEVLVPMLLGEVEHADLSASSAHLACCCLHSLMRCSRSAVDRVLELDGERILGVAKKVGAAQHELLANETQRCIGLLASPV